MILGPAPESRPPAKKVPRPAGLPPYLASMYETPLLTREQEQHLFRKMNYLKYKASVLRDRLDVRRPRMTAMELVLKFANDAAAVKNDIIRANLRLVVSIAKRYASGPGHLFELISDGNMSLIRAVEKFDFARGFRFSTYATWAIIKNFARTIPTELRQRARFHTGGEERLRGVEDIRPDSARRESAQSERRSEVLADPRASRRARAADHPASLRPGPRSQPHDPQGSRPRDGGDQGADPPTRGPRHGQAPRGRGRGTGRGPGELRLGVVTSCRPEQACAVPARVGRNHAGTAQACSGLQSTIYNLRLILPADDELGQPGQ